MLTAADLPNDIDALKALLLAIFQSVVQSMVSDLISQYPIPKLLQIIKILLEHGANPNPNPNAMVKAPAQGRTALMLAAESDSVPAFELILRHGGDPFRRDSAGSDSMKIARSFGAHRVLDYMYCLGLL